MTISKINVQTLMDISSAITTLTRTMEDLPALPAYIASRFGLAGVCLAVVKRVADGNAVVLNVSSRPPQQNLEQTILSLHSQTLQQGLHLLLPDATVFSGTIDHQHHMLLIASHDHLPLTDELQSLLALVAGHLCKCMFSLIAWQANPRFLGRPFDQLTEREWSVLRCLYSEGGEKQLADQLGMSPHTLHSHIKAIYRKAGVQGRLALLQRMEKAMRQLQLQQVTFTGPAESIRETALDAV